MTNPQQTEGLTAEQIAGVTPELASGDISAKALASVLEAGAKNQRPISRQYRSGNFNATADAEFICAAVKHFIDRPNPPAQEPVAWRCKVLMADQSYSVEFTDNVAEANECAEYEKNIVDPLYTSPPDQSSLIKVLTEALEAAHTQLTNLGDDTRKIILVDSSVSHDEIQAAVLDQVESALSMAKEGNHEPK